MTQQLAGRGSGVDSVSSQMHLMDSVKAANPNVFPFSFLFFPFFFFVLSFSNSVSGRQ